jgi:hypothetical protein
MKLYFEQVSGSILNIKPNKRNECFNWGVDNAFPSLIEALVGMSVTSKTCSDRVSKAIFGASFGASGDVIVNSKNQSLNEVLRIAARWYAKQNNCFLQIGYDANLDVKSIVVVPTTDVRVGNADDRNYSGKYIVYDNWDKSKSKQISAKSFQAYDRYNPDKKVIEGQVRNSVEKGKDKKIEDIISQYNGQILHIKKDETYIYALPDLSPVLSEALLESNSQTFRSRGSEKGFLNTKILTVAPFKDDTIRKEFKKDLNELRGAEGSNDVLLLETAQATDDISKQLSIDDLSGTYNDKLFEYSDGQAEKNITKAFSVNKILVDSTDGNSLGDSGGKLEEAQNQLWQSREEDRLQFEEAFSEIMKNFQEEKAIAEGLVIKNPFLDEDDLKEAKNVNKKAQANLRGSVGGVTALAGLIQSVNAGELTKESAVAVVKSIYGFTDTKAKEMIGGFDEEETV